MAVKQILVRRTGSYTTFPFHMMLQVPRAVASGVVRRPLSCLVGLDKFGKVSASLLDCIMRWGGPFDEIPVCIALNLCLGWGATEAA